MKQLGFFLLVLAIVTSSLTAQPVATGPKVAFLSVRNLDIDPRSDYVGGIIQGLLLFDLTRAPGITLVDRNSLDRVLREQELQLSGLLDNTDSSQRVGQLLGADFLVSADYVALSTEVLVTVKVVNVASGRSGAFVERGGTENTVHMAAESLVEYLTGSRPEFAGSGGERGIVSLRNEEPGSIAIHSYLIRGEIFFDGEFVGYTTGSITEPYVLEKVRPGRHSVRIHLGRGFGVVIQPEIRFADWQVDFELAPGERKVLRDGTRDLNSILYDLQQLLNETYYYDAATKARATDERSFDFLDRSGEPVQAVLKLNPLDAADGLILHPELQVGSELGSFTVASKNGSDIEFSGEVGLVRLYIRIDRRYNRTSLTIRLERNDIRQGMYNE
ncbi:MAG: CsgG/HfaB family protein [Spirochaetes bacterium]|nr:CsgG/HfaB family protein [Spirochaetota bacterium]